MMDTFLSNPWAMSVEIQNKLRFLDLSEGAGEGEVQFMIGRMVCALVYHDGNLTEITCEDDFHRWVNFPADKIQQGIEYLKGLWSAEQNKR